MAKQFKKDTWIWVVIQDPDHNPQLLGQHDAEADISFIPFFESKEIAQDCYSNLSFQKGRKYQIEAMFFDELAISAAENGFVLFLLDGGGKILEKIDPATAVRQD